MSRSLLVTFCLQLASGGNLYLCLAQIRDFASGKPLANRGLSYAKSLGGVQLRSKVGNYVFRFHRRQISMLIICTQEARLWFSLKESVIFFTRNRPHYDL
jgi:hypothetical protein